MLLLYPAFYCNVTVNSTPVNSITKTIKLTNYIEDLCDPLSTTTLDKVVLLVLLQCYHSHKLPTGKKMFIKFLRRKRKNVCEWWTLPNAQNKCSESAPLHRALQNSSAVTRLTVEQKGQDLNFGWVRRWFSSLIQVPGCSGVAPPPLLLYLNAH